MTPQAIREVIVGGQSVFRDDQLLRVPWSEIIGGVHTVTKDWPQP